MGLKSILGFLYILFILYLINLAFGFIELAFLESKMILVLISFFIAVESWKYFKKPTAGTPAA